MLARGLNSQHGTCGLTFVCVVRHTLSGPQCRPKVVLQSLSLVLLRTALLLRGNPSMIVCCAPLDIICAWRFRTASGRLVSAGSRGNRRRQHLLRRLRQRTSVTARRRRRHPVSFCNRPGCWRRRAVRERWHSGQRFLSCRLGQPLFRVSGLGNKWRWARRSQVPTR